MSVNKTTYIIHNVIGMSTFKLKALIFNYFEV